MLLAECSKRLFADRSFEIMRNAIESRSIKFYVLARDTRAKVRRFYVV